MYFFKIIILKRIYFHLFEEKYLINEKNIILIFGALEIFIMNLDPRTSLPKTEVVKIFISKTNYR